MSILDDLLKEVQSGDKKKKVVKTFKMKAAWMKAYKEMDKLTDDMKAELDALYEKHLLIQAKRRAFWAMVESETKHYGPMRINSKKGVIEATE